MTRIDAARAAWSQVLEALRSAPLVDACRLADSILRDIGELFPERKPPKGHRS